MMPRAIVLSGTPGEPYRGGELSKGPKIARGTTFKVRENHRVGGGHSLFHATSGA